MRAGALKETGVKAKLESVLESPRMDVDQDVFLMFYVVDENLSWYLEDNIQNCSDPAGVYRKDPDFEESNKMHGGKDPFYSLSIPKPLHVDKRWLVGNIKQAITSFMKCMKEGLKCVLFVLSTPPVCVSLFVTAINGYMFGNLPGIKLCQDSTVAWHLVGMGNEVDIHSVFFHGNTLLDRGHRTDVLSLFPATFATAQMVPKASGKWLVTCQVNDHLQGRAPDL